MITDDILERYRNGKLDEVYIIYTCMENSMTTVAEMRKLLPLSKEEFEVHMPIDVYQEELKADPSWDTILERLVWQSNKLG